MGLRIRTRIRTRIRLGISVFLYSKSHKIRFVLSYEQKVNFCDFDFFSKIDFYGGKKAASCWDYF